MAEHKSVGYGTVLQIAIHCNKARASPTDTASWHIQWVVCINLRGAEPTSAPVQDNVAVLRHGPSEIPPTNATAGESSRLLLPLAVLHENDGH